MSWQVQTAILKALKADDELAALVAAIDKWPRPNTEYPLITPGPDRDLPSHDGACGLSQCNTTILVWSLIKSGSGVRGPEQAQKICEKIVDIINGKNLVFPGLHKFKVNWQSTEVDPSDDGRVWFGTVKFETVVEKDDGA